MLVCASCYVHLGTRDRGCSAHPVFPAPSLFWGQMILQNSGAVCRENAYVRHRPRRRTIQYSEEPVIEPRTRGVLDTPPSRSMTVVGGASSLRGAFATKQSNSFVVALDCFAIARNDDVETIVCGLFLRRRRRCGAHRVYPERWHNQAFLRRRDERCSAGSAQDARGVIPERVKRFLSIPKMRRVSRGGTD
jgi:hypothetical protein